ncbi:putative pyruvyl transferase [Calothrix sp. NIES-2100]|uniref:polysaccharide pyruvyl transferase family protein n=1 Tax=Calothrix sp. NIES-2100 TaxID=1954172 RepID=UPI000B5DED9A|nr:putative pyruvyl transferase [Calothrix sp. NIES-2100]
MRKISYVLRPVAHFFKYELRNSLFWANSIQRNWGDDLNPWLYYKLTGKKAVYCPHKSCHRLLMAGSILSQAGKYDTCWGTGLISDNLSTPLKLFKALAVRGPLSAQKLQENGIAAPAIYGDPGLIASRLITLPKNKKYKCSVIPHYVDRVNGEKFAREMGFNLINVDLPIEKFIEEVASSEEVWSSSLHGIICAESMQIPTTWIKFSNHIIGGLFKYHDYLLGTNRDLSNPLDFSQPFKNKIIAQPLESFNVNFVIKNLLSVFPGKLKVKS